MATVCETYSDVALAHEAVERMLAAGTPAHRITLLCGSRPHDVRREPMGRFVGQIKPTDQVGTYGNVRRRRRQGRGAFAGDPDAQRQGSFGDVERDVIVTFEGQQIRTPDQLIVWIRSRAVCDTVTLTVNRGGQQRDLKMTLQASSSY